MKRLLDSIIKINYLFYKITNMQVFILFVKKIFSNWNLMDKLNQYLIINKLP